MSNERDGPSQVVILSDESAAWKIAGLAQLDRLVLAINEFAETIPSAQPIEVAIFWKPEIPVSARWIPRNARLRRVHLTEYDPLVGTGPSIVSTRLFVTRNAMAEFLSGARRVPGGTSRLNPVQAWQELSELCQQPGSRLAAKGWFFLAGPADFGRGEKLLLRGAGKSGDGIVAKYLSRPISRRVTHFLLKFPVTPNDCTLAILVLPVIAFFFLVRGDYTGFLVGTGLFHAYNILDGCDGELARAKYLDSEKGRRLDAFCDLIANLLFVLCLAVGLFRQPHLAIGVRALFLAEGLLAFLLEGGRLLPYALELLGRGTTRVVSRRHEEAVLDSSRRFLGKALTGLLFQITRRDVGFFTFFLLALVGVPSWILHIFFVYALITLLLALRDLRARSRSAEEG